LDEANNHPLYLQVNAVCQQPHIAREKTKVEGLPKGHPANNVSLTRLLDQVCELSPNVIKFVADGRRKKI